MGPRRPRGIRTNAEVTLKKEKLNVWANATQTVILNRLFERMEHPTRADICQAVEETKLDRKWILAWFARKRKAVKQNIKNASTRELFTHSSSATGSDALTASEFDPDFLSSAATVLTQHPGDAVPVYLHTAPYIHASSPSLPVSSCKNGPFCISCPLYTSPSSREGPSAAPYSHITPLVTLQSRSTSGQKALEKPMTTSTPSNPNSGYALSARSPSLGYIPLAFPTHSNYLPNLPNQIIDGPRCAPGAIAGIDNSQLDSAPEDICAIDTGFDLLDFISFSPVDNYRPYEHHQNLDTWLPDSTVDAHLS